jgi:putative ABC transport system permease protein
VSGFNVREQAASILVAALSTAFGVVLIDITGVIGTSAQDDSVTGQSHTVPILLGIAAFIFIAIAIYVGAVVTANTFSTIVAGRSRTIALLRLIGSTATAQRRSVAAAGLRVGLIGALIGAVTGTLVAWGLVSAWVTAGGLPRLSYSYAHPAALLPIAAVVLTTWLGAWIGSRRVLSVSPMQAIGASGESSRDELRRRPGRNALSITLFFVGLSLLVLSVLAGLVTPYAVLIGVVGGIVSFTGFILGAHLVMPSALRLVGRATARGPASRLAAENAVRYPERSTRTTIGLVIGVTLVTMFAVAMGGFEQIIHSAQAAQPETYAGVDAQLNVTVGVFSALTGFSALIAAVGMVNNLSLSVLQRVRELGLLRALGFTSAQIRRMILSESAQTTGAAVLVGLALGTFYGWVGAQSFLGAINGSPGVVVPVVPWAVLAAIVAAAVVLALVASVAPSRRATRISPVVALAAD